MVVGDFYIRRLAVIPTENQAPLLIDSHERVAHQPGKSSTPPFAPVVGSSPAMRDGDDPNDIGQFQIEDGVVKSICEKLAKPTRPVRSPSFRVFLNFSDGLPNFFNEIQAKPFGPALWPGSRKTKQHHRVQLSPRRGIRPASRMFGEDL